VFRVPEGSELAVRVAGGAGDESLTWLDALTGEASEIAASDAADTARTGSALARQFGGTLSADGMLTLHSGDDELQRRAFTVIPDTAPVIRLSEDPRRAVNGALELTYEIEDDYGATEAQAVFSQTEAAADAHPLYDAPEMPLTLPRRGADAKAARTSRDLT